MWANGQVTCQAQDTVSECIVRELIAIIAVENVESFSISAVAALYLLESRKRRHQATYKAW